MAQSSETKEALYQTINELKNTVAQWQRKFDTQSIQLGNTVAQLEERGAALAAAEARIASLESASALDVTAANRTSPKGAKDASTREAEVLREALQTKETTLKETTEELQRANRSLENMKASLSALEREKRRLEKKVAETDGSGLQIKPDPITDSPGRSRNVSKDLDAAIKNQERMKKQLIAVANDANVRQGQLQNELQAALQFVEEMRREYAHFIETARVEQEEARVQQAAEYDRLYREFERYKLVQYDDKRHLLREQQALVQAMQRQFDEYRSTAEALFHAEASKLEAKLSSQMERYDQEIKLIIKTKDALYDDMMTAKDAKIMSLIEGSDLLTVMQRHEMEIEHLQRQAGKEKDQMKALLDAEHKHMMQYLRSEKESLEFQIGKLNNRIAAQQQQLSEALKLVDAKNRELAEKELVHESQCKELQHKLLEANVKADEYVKLTNKLRHVIITTKYGLAGLGDDSVAGLTKRLKQDSVQLAGRYEALVKKFQSSSARIESLEAVSDDAARQVAVLKHEVAKRTEDFHALTKTFETFLASRQRGLAKERGAKSRSVSRTPAEGKTELSASRDLSLVPHPIAPPRASATPSSGGGGDDELRAELDTGLQYLAKFKRLSQAYARGRFDERKVQLDDDEAQSGLWEKFPLYSLIQANSGTDEQTLLYTPHYASTGEGPAPDSDHATEAETLAPTPSRPVHLYDGTRPPRRRAVVAKSPSTTADDETQPQFMASGSRKLMLQRHT